MRTPLTAIVLSLVGCSLALELDGPPLREAEDPDLGVDASLDAAVDAATDADAPADRDVAPPPDGARPDTRVLPEPDAEPEPDALQVRLDTGPDRCTDADDDGFGRGCAAGPDCNDRDPAVNPDAFELCNGVDDDCDEATDEDFGALGTLCVAGEGGCAREGRVECNDAGDGARCSVEAMSPRDEVCNAADDDCDGAVDEDVDGPGVPCSAGEGECAREGVQICTADGLSCDAEPGEPGVERCNGLDDNCDGAVDEPYPTLGEACVVGVGACAVEGRRVCGEDAASIVCDAIPGDPAEERCNEVDDDCDGITDEDQEVCGGDLCVDLQRDPENCGRCGRRCGDRGGCRDGECIDVLVFDGIRTNVDEDEIVGWAICFDAGYDDSGFSVGRLLAACEGDHVMVGCRRGRDEEWTVLAQGERGHVFRDTGGELDPANGVGWYVDPNRAFGFAPPGGRIELEPCDSVQGQDRLCWNMDDGQFQRGGRCGATRDIGFGINWQRRIWVR